MAGRAAPSMFIPLGLEMAVDKTAAPPKADNSARWMRDDLSRAANVGAWRANNSPGFSEALQLYKDPQDAAHTDPDVFLELITDGQNSGGFGNAPKSRIRLVAGAVSRLLLDSLGASDFAQAGGGFDVGDIKPSARAAAAAGWILCDGQAISRAAFAPLFAAIGTAYGVGDGSTTFNIPNLQGRVPVGSGTATGARGATAHALGQKSGEETHQLSVAELASHSHPPGGGITTFIGGAGGGSDFVSGFNWGQSVSTGNTGGNADHNNMQPYTVINFFIKV